MTRIGLPQPYEELDHTADAGVLVTADTAELALARLVLAFAQVVTGDGEIVPVMERQVVVDVADRAMMAIDVLRELLFWFDRERLVPASCEVRRFDPDAGAEVSVELGRYDEVAHAEGLAPKAITLHAARFEPEGQGWLAQVVFDI